MSAELQHIGPRSASFGVQALICFAYWVHFRFLPDLECARGPGIGGGDGGFDAELVRRAGFALPMHSTSGHGRNKVSNTLALLLRADLSGARQRPSNHRLKLRLAGNLCGRSRE